jgi:hypothetical protein
MKYKTLRDFIKETQEELMKEDNKIETTQQKAERIRRNERKRKLDRIYNEK